MKSVFVIKIISLITSPPSRGAWIEIAISKFETTSTASPPSRGAWIEIRKYRGPGAKT